MDTEWVAVVGANYGDEGKGRLVNYLSDPDSLVVRYSGSAQAAHTVVENNTRHVFKHVGSGALRGASTLLGESFLCHPLLFNIEYEQLSSVGICPDMVADARSLVVLPTDMIINQATEKIRGSARHGSCGMGIRQAMERGTNPLMRINLTELDWLATSGRLSAMARHHLRLWCRMNGYQEDQILELVGVKDLEHVMMRFQGDARLFCDRVEIFNSEELSDLLSPQSTVILEGSQGLGLDPGIGQLPHLTPSHVGLGGLASFFRHNVDSHATELEIVYVTRPYLTRHGAGPLPRENEWTIPVTDETNIPNDWQGSLRFAPLVFPTMRHRILTDMEWLEVWPGERPTIRFSLAVTCLDQVENTDFHFYGLDGERKQGLSAFLNECGALIEMMRSSCLPGRLITCFGEEAVDTHESREDARVLVA